MSGILPHEAQAQALDARNVLQQAMAGFADSASQDPLTQQRMIACLSSNSGILGAVNSYSTYRPEQWGNIDSRGFDLQNMVGNINQLISRCKSQASSRSLR